jgi:DNA-binding NarL/FixJ family response regulator
MMIMTKITLAIVDDHALFRRGMISLLTDLPDIEVVLEAENGRELLDRLPTHPAEIILLDMQMPVMDGFATLPILKKQHPAAKALALTMYNDEAMIAHVMELGASGYLAKDAGMEEVERAIRRTAATGYYFSDKVSRVMLSIMTHTGERKPQGVSFQDLTDREQEVIQMICQELTTAEIADQLCLSPRTVEGHRNRLLDKTGTRNTAGLIVFAAKQGWLDAMIKD